MTKHTKGPWYIENHKIKCAGGYSVADIHGAKTSEGLANAALIAAAPKMLEALKELLEWAENACGCSGNDEVFGCQNDAALKAARAAIAGAEGGAP